MARGKPLSPLVITAAIAGTIVLVVFVMRFLQLQGAVALYNPQQQQAMDSYLSKQPISTYLQPIQSHIVGQRMYLVKRDEEQRYYRVKGMTRMQVAAILEPVFSGMGWGAPAGNDTTTFFTAYKSTERKDPNYVQKKGAVAIYDAGANCIIKDQVPLDESDYAALNAELDFDPVLEDIKVSAHSPQQLVP